MITRATPVPLYHQIAEHLRGQISSGKLPPAAKLPSEHALCAQFSVSRSVVRQALAALVADGLVETQRGRGAFVRARRVPVALHARLDPLETELDKAGFRLTTRMLAQKLIDAPAYIAEQIGDSRAIYLKRLRYADGQILLLVENYIPYARTPDLLGFEGFETTSLYQHMAAKYGIIATTGRRLLEVGRTPGDVAELLGLEPVSRAMFNREITRDQAGDVLEYYESWHHPDHTQLAIELRRDGA